MRKHTAQYKLEVVQYYLSGKAGSTDTGRYFGVAKSLVRRWVAFYRAHGIDGLASKPMRRYTAQFKLTVLEHMWQNKLSYTRTAATFDVRSQCVIAAWERAFHSRGAAGLGQPTVEKKRIVPDRTKPPKPTSDSGTPPSTGSEPTREQLVEDNERLRMENAFLKKFNALAQSRAQKTPPPRRKP